MGFIRLILFVATLIEWAELIHTYWVWGQDKALEILIKHHPDIKTADAYGEFRNHLMFVWFMAVVSPAAFIILTLIYK